MKSDTFLINPDGSCKSVGNINIWSSDKAKKFTARVDINQFLRDGEAITAFYEQTLDIIYLEDIYPDAEDLALDIFNSAYEICWQMAICHVPYLDVSVEMPDSYGDSNVEGIVWCIVWSILTIYTSFYDVDKSELDDIRKSKVHKYFISQYRKHVRILEEPSCAICFSTPGVLIDDRIISPVGVYKFEKGSVHSDHVEKVRSAQTPSKSDIASITGTENTESKSSADLLDKAVTLVQNVFEETLAEKQRLEDLVKKLEEDHKKIIQGKDTTIRRLRKQLEELQEKNSDNSQVKSPEVEAAGDKSPLSAVVNCANIQQYALGLNNFGSVLVIVQMLSSLSRRHNYYAKELMDCINVLEEYWNALQKPQPMTQNNNGCLQLYGEVKDSNFNAPNPNE